MQLPRFSDKQKSNQTTRPRKTAKREATRHRKNNYTERMQKENDLALSADVRSLGQRTGVVICYVQA
jgi:hypothetical protein